MSCSSSALQIRPLWAGHASIIHYMFPAGPGDGPGPSNKRHSNGSRPQPIGGHLSGAAQPIPWGNRSEGAGARRARAAGREFARGGAVNGSLGAWQRRVGRGWKRVCLGENWVVFQSLSNQTLTVQLECAPSVWWVLIGGVWNNDWLPLIVGRSTYSKAFLPRGWLFWGKKLCIYLRQTCSEEKSYGYT